MFIKRCKSSVKSGFIDGSYWGYKVLLENNQGFIKYTEFITKKKGRGRFKPLNLCSQSQFLIYMSFCIQNNKNQLELALEYNFIFSLPPVVWSNHDPREMDGATMGVQSSLQKYFFKNLEKCTSSNSPENMCRSIPGKCRLKFVKITIPGGRAAPQ